MSLIFRESPVESTTVEQLYRKAAELIGFDPERVFKRKHPTQIRKEFQHELYKHAAAPEIDALLEEIESIEDEIANQPRFVDKDQVTPIIYQNIAQLVGFRIDKIYKSTDPTSLTRKFREAIEQARGDEMVDGLLAVIEAVEDGMEIS